MKLLVFVDHLIIGGVPINAIDLAATLAAKHGHDVVMFGSPGPASQIARQRGLRLIDAPPARGRPSLARMRALRRTIRTERPDVLQVWDWRACLDAYHAAYLSLRVPILLCHSTMELERMLPKHTPTTYMTPELADQARRDSRSHVTYLPVPTDLSMVVQTQDPEPFRAACGASSTDVLFVTVSRLDTWIKSESLMRTVSAVCKLGRSQPSIMLAIVGDGEARPMLEKAAQETNARLGRRAVVLCGEMADPRAAYAAADVVVGMGGSALRGMAAGKPVIIVGKNGFADKLDAKTQDMFLYQGMYGYGDGSDTSLEAAMRSLTGDAVQRDQDGAVAQRFVQRHFDLPTTAAVLNDAIKHAATFPQSRLSVIVDGLRMAGVYTAGRVVPSSLKNVLKSAGRLRFRAKTLACAQSVQAHGGARE